MKEEMKVISGEETYIEEVKQLVKTMKYGSVTLIIQDGRVIQIDKTEKIRLKS